VAAVGVGIFVLTCLPIASRHFKLLPIGRPAGALLGAVLMVGFSALTPEETYRAVDHGTIILLFGMMLVTACLDHAGFFGWISRRMLTWCRTPWGLLAMTATLPGLLAALLLNDAVCLFLTPVVVASCLRAELPMGPYLIALAMSANIGSAATLVGNPQNMIIGQMSGYDFAGFLLRAGPAAIVGLAVNLGLLWLYYRKRLPERLPSGYEAPATVDRKRLALAGTVLAGVVAAFFAGANLGYATLAGVAVLVTAERQEPRIAFQRVDWPLLVFFCALFVVVAGLNATGIVDRAWGAASPHVRLEDPSGLAAFAGVMTLGSNVVSNVPMVLLTGPNLARFGHPDLGWVLLAYTTTVAGNLTLVGSVANLIVAEGAREHYVLGFREYLKFGAASTLLVLAAGVPVIWLICRALG
jgi:Na+/H+ antiporter NhaD/arsenite permease-like protein